MSKKVFCKVETNKEKISDIGRERILEPLIKLNKLNYIFKAEIIEERNLLIIELPNFLFSFNVDKNDRWTSVFSVSKERINKKYTFVIMEDQQLEFDF